MFNKALGIRYLPDPLFSLQSNMCWCGIRQENSSLNLEIKTLA